MKVLNLRCMHDHRFEGWFDSEDDFLAQHEGGLVECPICADKHISRLPSAPRLNVSNLREVASPPRPAEDAETQVQAQSRWIQAVRHLMKNTEDVGERFPEEARRIHYGEVPGRGIRGQATREDADALREEGIEVMAVAVPSALKGNVQ
jgi:hypothetical protein